jgi:cell division protein FtsA
LPAKSNAIVALDIGTTRVVVAVGMLTEGGEVGILGVGATPSHGLRKGVVIDVDETVSAISAALEQAERVSGIRPEVVTISVNGSHVSSLNSKGVIAVGRADGEISPDDIHRVIEAAQAVSIPTNREIIHVIPRIFTVDGQEGIKDPVGMSGVRLEAETHIITGSTPIIKNLTRPVFQAGLTVDELVLAPLAAARSTLGKRQRELGSVLIDLGGGTTGISVFEEGDILATSILPVGAAHVTGDIAIGLRTSLEAAEHIKVEHGFARPEAVSEKEKIKVTLEETGETVEASRRQVAEIIEARLEEIFSLVRAELGKIGRDALLPAGAVLTGGGAKLPGLVDLAKEELRLPASIGTPQAVQGLAEQIEDPSYATAIGLLLWAADSGEVSGWEPPGRELGGAGLSKARQWLKNFLP